METKTKALIGAGMIAIGAISGGIGVLCADDSVRVAELEAQVAELNVTAEPVVKFVNVTKEVEVPVNVTVIKEVEVDNGKLAMVTDRLEDMGIFEDAEEVVAEIEAEDGALALAVEKIQEELADEDFVEDELVDSDILEDEDEFEVIRIYTDYDDVEVIKSNFDKEEYKFEIKVKLDDEEAEKKVYTIFKVGVEDGEAEILSVSLK